MKTITLQIIQDVFTQTSGTLKKGQVVSFELLDQGTNWVRVKLPNGARKTLFNFDAKRISAS